MGAAIARHGWPYRVVRYVRVRIIGRYRSRNFWPSPNDIERMSTDEREAWFKSIGLDEQIAAAKADYARETEQDPTRPTYQQHKLQLRDSETLHRLELAEEAIIVDPSTARSASIADGSVADSNEKGILVIFEGHR